MAAYLTPGLYYETVDTGPPRLPAVRTDIAAFVGVAARGPLDQPTPVRSWAQFQGRFGAFLAGPFLAYCVKGFFENGGVECHVVRVAAAAAATATDPMAIQPADLSYAIVLSTAGFVPGAVVSVSQAPGLAEDVLLAEVDPVQRKLKWTHPLMPAFVAANAMDFATGQGAAGITLLDAAGLPTIEISAESPGSWGNQITVRVEHTSRAATRTRAVAQPPGGDASFVESVAGLDAHSLLKVFQDQSPAPSVERYHTGSPDAAGRRIVWDAPLEPAYNLGQAIDFESLEFTVSVYERGTLREVFARLSLVDGHPNYVNQAIREGTSNYVRARDLGSPSAFPDSLPVPGTVRLHAGRDGTAALQTGDFTGDPGSDRRRGLRTLEKDLTVSTVAMPDILMRPSPPVEFSPVPPAVPDPCLPCAVPPPDAPPPVPALIESIPGFSLDDIGRVQQALITHCEAMRYRVALLDPPLFSTGKESVDFAEIQTWRHRFDSKFGALYFPWVLVYDPLPRRNNVVRAVPPCGHVAGIYARTDLENGVHYAPANRPVLWAQDVTFPVDGAKQGVLNPAGINCIRSFPGRGLLLYGARTVSSLTSWQYVNVRRLMNMIEESIEDAMQWAVFEPNDFQLRKSLVLTISSFLGSLWRRGALRGTTVDEAFFVQCNDENNPPDLAQNGQLAADVGVAPSIPAEFVVFRVGRANEVLEVSE